MWLNLNALNNRLFQKIDIDKHTSILIKTFVIIQNDTSKSNLWICSKPYYLKVKLFECLKDGFNESIFATADKIFTNFAQSIIDAEGQPNFNAESMMELFLSNDDYFSVFTDYDIYYDRILEMKVERNSQLAKARYVLDRCHTLLKNNESNKVIKYLGKVFNYLNKEESKYEYITSLGLFGSAFKQIGLNFAARQYFFACFCESMDYLLTEKELHFTTKHIIKYLKELELSFGKIINSAQLNSLDIKLGTYYEDENNPPFELFIAGLLLKTSPREYSKLTKLHGYLNENDLLVPEIVLKRMLGYYDEEFAQNEKMNIDDFILSLTENPFYSQLISIPFFGYESSINFSSIVLGCKINLKTENKKYLNEYSMCILGGVESFLSTAIDRQSFSIKSNFYVSIESSNSSEFEIELLKNQEGITIKCPNIDNIFNKDIQEMIQKNFFESVLFVSSLITSNHDLNNYISLEDSEGIFSRSIFPLSPLYNIQNILGDDFFMFPQCDSFIELKPNEMAFLDVPKAKYKTDKNVVEKRLGDIEISNLKYSSNIIKNIRHDSISIDDFINVFYWDKALWKGVIYLYTPGGIDVPILLLAYKEIDYGVKIFEEWINKYGRVDENIDFKIEIIKGVIKEEPNHYRVSIGRNPQNIILIEDALIGYKSRNITMEPKSLINIDNFEKNLSSVFYLRVYNILWTFKKQ